MLIIQNPENIKIDTKDLEDSLKIIINTFSDYLQAIAILPTTKNYRDGIVGPSGVYHSLLSHELLPKIGAGPVSKELGRDLILVMINITDYDKQVIGKCAVVCYKGFDRLQHILELATKIYIIYSRSNGLQTLQVINTYILGIVDKNELLQKIVDLVVDIGDYKVGYLTLVENGKVYAKTMSKNLISVQVSLKLLGKPFDQFSADLEKDDTFTIRAIKENKIYIGDKFHNFVSPPAPYLPTILGEKLVGVSRHIAVPINTKDGVIGTLNIASSNDFSNNEIFQLKSFADQIGIAISITNLFSQKETQLKITESKNSDLESLFKLSSSISKTLDPDQVAQQAVNSLPQDENMIGAILETVDTKTKQIRVAAVSQNDFSRRVLDLIGDFSQYIVPYEDPKYAHLIVVKAYQTKNVTYTSKLEDVISPPVPGGFIPAIKKILNIKSVVIYPVLARGEVTALLGFFLKNKEFQELDINQIQLLQTYTSQIAIAMENATLYKNSQETQMNLQQTLNELQEIRRRERDMIDVMGHELRTPITIVRNALLVLDADFKQDQAIATEKLKKYLDMSVESTRREMTLIETLLSATKVEGKRIQLTFGKVDMIDVINDSLEAHKKMAEKKKVALIFTPPLQPVFVYADRVRTQEIMDNFLSNAVKYTARGSINITISGDSEFVRVTVKDTGVGINPQDLEHLGKKFFRAQSFFSSDQTGVLPSGTGLGLYVTFELIRIMNGKREIKSEVGKGSEFSFSLPVYHNQPDKSFDQTFMQNQDQPAAS